MWPLALCELLLMKYQRFNRPKHVYKYWDFGVNKVLENSSLYTRNKLIQILCTFVFKGFLLGVR